MLWWDCGSWNSTVFLNAKHRPEGLFTLRNTSGQGTSASGGTRLETSK